jgi:hypothetical protein
MVAEWTPEALVPPTSDAIQHELDSLPVIQGCALPDSVSDVQPNGASCNGGKRRRRQGMFELDRL